MSSKEFHNWCKLQFLLNTRASELLRSLFQKLWHDKFNKDFDGSSGQDLVKIIKPQSFKNYFKSQKDLLQNGDLLNWDLQLLRNVFFDSDICGSGNHYRKNANKLAEYRNKLEHSASRTVSSNDFGNYWATICNILIDMGDSKEGLGELKGSMNLQKIIIMQGQNIVKVNELKNEGNKYFKKKKYDEAISSYTNGIDLEGIPDQDLAALYSCRSGCYFEKRDFENALNDAKRSKRLNREWYQAYLRIGKAYLELNELEKAKKALERALLLEPNNEEIKTLLNSTKNTKRIQDNYEHLDPGMKGIPADEWSQDFKLRTGIDMNTKEQKRFLKFVESQNPVLEDVWKGHDYRDGTRGVKQNYAMAAKCYQKAVDKGNAEAMYNLGKMIEYGLGVKKDFALAFSLFKRAAEQPPFDPIFKQNRVGVAEAEHSLGISYSEGVYVRQDKLQAVYWYERAVEHGSAWSANNLGLLYMNGQGVKQDLKRAEQLFLLAASRKDSNAPGNLVTLYKRQKDLEKASKWNKISIEKGSIFAISQLEELESMKSAEQETLKELGIIEWEKVNNLASDGLTLSERTQRRLTLNQNPEFANLLEKAKKTFEEISIPQPAVNQRTGFKFNPDELERYSHTSETAKRMLDAMIHFVLSFGVFMDILKDTQPIGLDNKLCRLFIARLAESYRIEHIVASFPMEKIPDVKNIVEKIISQIHTLRQKESLSKELSDLDQDARLCFAVLNLGSPKTLIDFLSESLQKYPQNKEFFLFRGNAYSFEQRHEDGLRDYNRLLEMEPDNFYFLYLKAVSLRLLGHPNAVKAYEEYLAKAPIDDRKRPEAYYSMGNCTFYSSQQSKGSGQNKAHIMKKTLKEYYDLGLEMEEKQLPFFLPYVSNSKKALELIVNAQSFLDKKESASKPDKIGKNSSVNEPSHREAPKKEPAFQNYSYYEPDLQETPKEQVIQDLDARAKKDLKPDLLKKLKKAAGNDQASLDVKIASCYREGAGGAEKNLILANQFLQRAVDQGNAEAIYNLAIMTQRGLGVKKDAALAFSLFKKAAEQSFIDPKTKKERVGVALAEHTVGNCYLEGVYVEKDILQAIYWFERAIEHGSGRSANHLGLIYTRGQGVQQDLEKAEQLFLLAISREHPASGSLADLYRIQKLPEKGLEWNRVAMREGSVEAESQQEKLELMLSELQETCEKLEIAKWEKENRLNSNGLTLKERILRRVKMGKDPRMMNLLENAQKTLNEILAPAPPVHYSQYFKYNIYELEKHSHTSETAKRMFEAMGHFTQAFEIFHELVQESDNISLDNELCRQFVTKLAKCYRIEFIVASFPDVFLSDAQSIPDAIVSGINSLRQKGDLSKELTDLDQDARLCFAVLNLKSPNIVVHFLSNDSLKKYPQNRDFLRFRGEAYCLAQRDVDAVRDYDKLLESEPDNYAFLYEKAVSMKYLGHVSVANAIKVYEEYLTKAPVDDHKRPGAYYDIADCEYYLSQHSKGHQGNRLKRVKEYYDLGLEMEKKQLPFFLPFKSACKDRLEPIVKALLPFEKKEAPSQQIGKAKLKDPLRKELIIDQRQCIKGWGKGHSGKWIGSTTMRPQKEQKLPDSLVGLKPVYLNEINFTKDHILNGYILEVTVIDLPLYTGSSIMLVVEDKNGHVQSTALYNMDESEADVQELGVGSHFSIINPYIRMAMDGKPMIRVDDPSTVIFGERVKDMCACCGAVFKDLLLCGACKSSAYCSEECQKIDWKEFQHKLICVKK